MEISQFNPEQIDEVARMAASVWGKEQGAHGAEVARVFCGHLSRQYYVNHGYEKIGEGVAPEFSTDKEDYTYYIFRRRIL